MNAKTTLLHLSMALVLSAVSVRAQISNGDFSANAASYTVFPGYSGTTTRGTNPSTITDWTEVESSNYIGLNGTISSGEAAGGPENEFGPQSYSINTGGSVQEYAFIQHNSAALEQSFDVVAGQTYQLLYDAGVRGATSPDNSGAGITAVIADGATGSGTVLLSQTSDLSSTEFYANTSGGGLFTGASTFKADMTGAVLLTFSTIDPTNGDVTADVANVSVAAVPEPAIHALWCGGLLFFIFHRSRPGLRLGNSRTAPSLHWEKDK
jgi:hypothetical protein